MLPPAAIQQFRERQRQLIHDAYNRAWAQGVAGYTPDADPDQPSPSHQHHAEEATLTGVSLLRARAARAYRPPAQPHADRRQRSLAAALSSTDLMAAELATLAPTPGQMGAAQEQADEGNTGAETAIAALGLAVAAWAEANAYRLDAGASVAWAGEQAGYGEAADQDGQLLQWQSEDDDSVCGDCEGLEDLGPMPLSEFPTAPGDGATECNVGCRCAWESVPVETVPGDELAPLGDSEEATLDKVAVQAQERLDQLAPEF